MSLLAVDLGLRTGLALYGRDGRLVWYRSQNYGSPARLKRAAHGVLHGLPQLEALVLEGGGDLADIWAREGERRGLTVLAIHAGAWREALLPPREQTSGARAKHFADGAARRVIAWSGAPRPTSLRHDAAEAILVGLWAVLHLGWLPAPPPGFAPTRPRDSV
ncbi:hypothetical protein [Desulfocurvus sp. DL9XJH121]